MKTILAIMTVCLMIMQAAFPQKLTADKVPATVKQAFEKRFPAAINVKYEMEKDVYEISFKEDQMMRSANFDQTGHWLETETVMKQVNLPGTIKTSLEKNFPGFSTSEIVMVESPDNGLQFEMEVRKGKEGYEVLFSPVGDIVRQKLLKDKHND